MGPVSQAEGEEMRVAGTGCVAVEEWLFIHNGAPCWAESAAAAGGGETSAGKTETFPLEVSAPQSVRVCKAFTSQRNTWVL